MQRYREPPRGPGYPDGRRGRADCQRRPHLGESYSISSRKLYSERNARRFADSL